MTYAAVMVAVYLAGGIAYASVVFPRAFLSAYWRAMSWPWRFAGAVYTVAVVLTWPVSCPFFALVGWVLRPSRSDR